MDLAETFQYERVVDSICGLNWRNVNQEELKEVATIYYYFSIQFRENLQIARQLYPDDAKLIELEAGECATDNLSPWPGVAQAGERLDHDEFMRRALERSPIDASRREVLDKIGRTYLANIRDMNLDSRALSIASYEDRGLDRVFTAILTSTPWHGATLEAFQHFLEQHIKFDLDPELGHGALARHLTPNDDVLPLWMEFKQALVEAVPSLLI